jgi:hypothetical protein
MRTFTFEQVPVLFDHFSFNLGGFRGSLEVETRSFPTSQNRDVGHPLLLLSGRPFESGFAEFAYVLERIGGADRDRTGDPLLAKQVLSQLSYSPLPY